MLEEVNYFYKLKEKLDDGIRNENKRDIMIHRKQREFIAEDMKDDGYWEKRRRNNKAAKRSREKRKENDTFLENKVKELSADNYIIKKQLMAVCDKYGIRSEDIVLSKEEMVNLPYIEQVFNTNQERLDSDIVTSNVSCQNQRVPENKNHDVSVFNENSALNIKSNETQSYYSNLLNSYRLDRHPNYSDTLYRQDIKDSDQYIGVSNEQALNLSTKYNHPEHTRPISSTIRETCHVTSNSSLCDGSSSGDESLYSTSSTSRAYRVKEGCMLPQSIRANETNKETNNISLTDIIKQEQAEQNDKYVETENNRLLYYSSLNQIIDDEEPTKKKIKTSLGNIQDEQEGYNFREQLATLTSNVEILKKMLMIRMD